MTESQILNQGKHHHMYSKTAVHRTELIKQDFAPHLSTVAHRAPEMLFLCVRRHSPTAPEAKWD